MLVPKIQISEQGRINAARLAEGLEFNCDDGGYDHAYIFEFIRP